MRRMKGFTLLELLITLSIASLLLSVALPNLSDMIANQHAKRFGYSLHEMLQFSRQAAVLNNLPVTLCQTDPRDTMVCLKKKKWVSGAMAFVDSDNDGVIQTSIQGGNDILLKRFPPPPSTGQLTATRRFFRFYPAGTSNTSASLRYCPDNPNAKPTRVVVMYTGRVRFAKPAEIGCIA